MKEAWRLGGLKAWGVGLEEGRGDLSLTPRVLARTPGVSGVAAQDTTELRGPRQLN
jgi:hypothetical protein